MTSGGSGNQWFSLWLDPANYIQPPSQSAEIDLIENLGPREKLGTNDTVTDGLLPPGTVPNVQSNFAGCGDGPFKDYCHEASWDVPGNAVKHHITLKYDKASKRVEERSPACAERHSSQLFQTTPLAALVARLDYEAC